MQNRILLACLVFSGFSGLAYELLWVRMLSFAFGSTTMSFSTVLAVFFGGLALGSWLASKYLDKVKNPVRTYAILELIMGVLGLLLYPVLISMDSWFALIDVGPNMAGMLLRFAIAGTVLIVPTMLMGMTLPVICRAMIINDKEIGHGTSLIYGINTFGAFLGAFLTTYHLLPNFGIFQSIIFAMAANFIAAGVAWFFAKETATAPKATAAVDDSSRGFKGLVIVAAFLSGFSFISFEVIWSRLFSIFLEGTIYGIGSVLIAVLIGITLGSFLANYIFKKSWQLNIAYVVTQMLGMLAVLAIITSLVPISYFLSSLKQVTVGVDPIFIQLLGVFLVLGPPSILTGASLPILVKIAEGAAVNTGKTLGRLYAFNTVGSILGSLVMGFYVLPELGSETAVFLGLFVASLGILTVGLGSLRYSNKTKYACLATAVLSLLVAMSFDGYNRKIFASNLNAVGNYSSFKSFRKTVEKHSILFSEGKTSSVSVNRSPTGLGLTLNALGQGQRNFLPPHHILESLLVALTPYVHNEPPKSALVVGLGAGVTVDLFRILGLSRIKVIELEEKVIKAVDQIFLDDSPVKSDRVDVEINDARHFLLVNSKKKNETFDVITSMPAHPWVASAIFTEEFFEIAKANLSENGVFSTWFGVGKMNEKDVKSVIRSFSSVFNQNIIYSMKETGSYFLVGGKSKLSLNLATLSEALKIDEINLHSNLDQDYFPARAIASSQKAEDRPKAGVKNTDDNAYVEVNAPKQKQAFQSWTLPNFFPRDFLAVDMIQGVSGRNNFIVNLCETLLGTPNGALISESSLTRLDMVQRYIDGYTSELSESEKAYLSGRVLLADKKTEAAALSFEKISESESGLKNRANKFYEIYLAIESVDVSALFAYADQLDIAAIIADIDFERLPDYIFQGDFDPEKQPLHWLMGMYKNLQHRRITKSEITSFQKHVFNRILKSRFIGIKALGLYVAEKAELIEERVILMQGYDALVQSRSVNYRALGDKVYREKNYQKSIFYYELALKDIPNDTDVLMRLYNSYKKMNDEKGRQWVSKRFALLGRRQIWLDKMDQFIDEVSQVPEQEVKVEPAMLEAAPQAAGSVD